MRLLGYLWFAVALLYQCLGDGGQRNHLNMWGFLILGNVALFASWIRDDIRERRR